MESNKHLHKKHKGKKKKRRKLVGAPPGSLQFIGEKKIEEPNINLTIYNETIFKHITPEKIELSETADETIHWFDIRGVHEVELIEKFGNSFKIHPLILEDVLDTHQRPKYEEYDNGVFIIVRALSFDKETLQIKTEQIAMYLSKNLLISFQEDEVDTFFPIHKRLEGGSGRIRKRGADYLTYALIDTIVDNYYVILDNVEEVIDEMEVEIIDNPNQETKSRIHLLKREMLTLRKAITPLREAVSKFSKSEHELINDSTELFIRDLYDHIVQIQDSTETYRDTLSGLQDLYISEISFKMNNVMQVLTIITTIFVPLSFLAGLYGMNFKFMPELEWRYSYFVLLGVMFTLAVTLLVVFKRNNWM